MITEDWVEIVIVPSADDMSSDIFVKHMNKRHQESLGGMSELVQRHLNKYVEECYRIFHDRLHKVHVRTVLDHEHLD
jgi:hypothetical protein